MGDRRLVEEMAISSPQFHGFSFCAHALFVYGSFWNVLAGGLLLHECSFFQGMGDGNGDF